METKTNNCLTFLYDGLHYQCKNTLVDPNRFETTEFIGNETRIDPADFCDDAAYDAAEDVVFENDKQELWNQVVVHIRHCYPNGVCVAVYKTVFENDTERKQYVKRVFVK